MLRTFFHREQGQGLVEYALILVLIAVVIIGIIAVVDTKPGLCAEGYFWSYRERACLSGYRPGQGR